MKKFDPYEPYNPYDEPPEPRWTPVGIAICGLCAGGVALFIVAVLDLLGVWS